MPGRREAVHVPGGVPLWDTDPKVFEQMFALNLRSGCVLSRVVVAVMLKQGQGCDRQRGFAVGSGACSGDAGLCDFEDGCVGDDEFIGRGLKGRWCSCEFRTSEHHRYEANRTAMPKADTRHGPSRRTERVSFSCVATSQANSRSSHTGIGPKLRAEDCT